MNSWLTVSAQERLGNGMEGARDTQGTDALFPRIRVINVYGLPAVCIRAKCRATNKKHRHCSSEYINTHTRACTLTHVCTDACVLVYKGTIARFVCTQAVHVQIHRRAIRNESIPRIIVPAFTYIIGDELSSEGWLAEHIYGQKTKRTFLKYM